MLIYYLFLSIKEKISKYIPVKITIYIKIKFKYFSILDIQIDKKYKKYQDLPMYTGLIKYLLNEISICVKKIELKSKIMISLKVFVLHIVTSYQHSYAKI